MAADSGALVQALVDGGLSATVARVIASALANASTPQYSQSRDIADTTPRDQLRLVTKETRKYLLTNLDYSAEQPYQDRLQSSPGRFAGGPSDHPYKDSQPVQPVPPLSKPSINGGDYVNVDNKVQDNTPVSTISLKLGNVAGGHMRVNSAIKAVDCVPLQFSSPQGLVTGVVSENTSSTAVELAVRQLVNKTVVLSDGTSYGAQVWPDASVTPATVFTAWAQQNLMNKSTATDVLTALGSAAYSSGTWTPAFIATGTGAVNPSVTYNTTQTTGRYTKIGEMVFVSGRITLSAMASAGTGIIVLSGLPFTVLAGQPGYAAGAVSYKTGWTTQGPTHCYSQPGANFLSLSYHTATGVTLITQANLSATVDAIFSCVYRTAA